MTNNQHSILSKLHCRMMAIIGLCLAMLFVSIMPSYISKADNTYYFGSFNNGVPVQLYTSSSYLLNMIQQAFNTAAPTYDYSAISFQSFSNILQNIGIYNDFALWDINNPEWYVNISYYSVDGWSNYSAITINFTKSNCLPTSNPVRLPSGDIRYSDNNNNLKFLPLSYQYPYGVVVPTLIGNNNNFSTHSVKYQFKDIFTTSVNGSSNINSSFEFYPNETYDYYFHYDDDFDLNLFQNAWNTFLNDSDIFNFNLFYSFTDGSLGNFHWRSGFSYNFGIKLSSSFHCYPIFSSFYTWDINTIDYDVNVELNTSNYIYTYQLIDKGHEDYGDFWSSYLSYGINPNSNIINTPTPIPTFSPITTPSPVPTFIIPVTITPITLPVNPIIDNAYGDPISYVMAMINMVGSVLSSNVVTFFSTVVSYIYNSSIFFEILMFVIPAIILIAFVVGRLKKK